MNQALVVVSHSVLAHLHSVSQMIAVRLTSSCVPLSLRSTTYLCSASGFAITLLTRSKFSSQERMLGCQWYFTNAAVLSCALFFFFFFPERAAQRTLWVLIWLVGSLK